MQIRVKIHKVFETKKPMKAVASIVLGDEFAVHDVKLIENEKGRFAVMPSKTRMDKDGNKVFSDVFHPISSSARKSVEDALFASYDEAVASKAE